MNLFISTVYRRGCDLYSDLSNHASKNKQRYFAAALAALAGGGAYSYFNSSNLVVQEGLDTWCQAYHFDGAQPFKSDLGKSSESVDQFFLTNIKKGHINEVCMGPNPGIWDSESKIKFSHPNTNVLPNFLGFSENRLQVLKLLEEYKLIDTTPKASTDYSLLHEVYDLDSLKYLLDKRTFLRRAHSVNQPNSDGLSPLGQIIKMRKSLKKDFNPLLEFLFEHGADSNYHPLNTSPQSPLGVALSSYVKESSIRYDDSNGRLTDLVDKLLAHAATLRATDFYKFSTEPAVTILTERTILYEALRRMAKQNPDVLKKLIENGLDLSGKTPYTSSVRGRHSEIKQNSLIKPLLFQFLYHLGIDDLYFKSARNPSKITKNLETCLTILTEGYSDRQLREFKTYDFGRGKEVGIWEYVQQVDHTPDQTLVTFFKKRLGG